MEVEGSAVRRRRVGMPCGFAGEVELVTSEPTCNEAAVYFNKCQLLDSYWVATCTTGHAGGNHFLMFGGKRYTHSLTQQASKQH